MYVWEAQFVLDQVHFQLQATIVGHIEPSPVASALDPKAYP